MTDNTPDLADIIAGSLQVSRAQAYRMMAEAVRLNAQALSVIKDDITLRSAFEQGYRLQYFVVHGYDSEWTDYKSCDCPTTQGGRLVWRVKAAAPAAPQPAPVDQNEARDAARWRYIAQHIGVAWNEQGFTSLVRIVSDKHREMLGDMVDRMMAGDWPEAAPQPARTALEQYDLEQSGDYRKGYDDGRVRGYGVGYRQATEHAAMKSQPAQQPLTDEQMWELWNKQGSDEMNQQEAINFARAIEQAHGIGVKNER